MGGAAVWGKKRPGSWGHPWRRLRPPLEIFFFLSLLMMMMNFISHGTQDLYPTFLKIQRGFSTEKTAIIAVIYNVGAVAGGICFGAFSDRMGRRRSMMLALVLALLLIPLWAYAPGTP